MIDERESYLNRVKENLEYDLKLKARNSERKQLDFSKVNKFEAAGYVTLVIAVAKLIGVV